jgi:hypothetical protein
VILGNPAMIQAYQTGIPGNGKPVPDGVRQAVKRNAAKRTATRSATTIPVMAAR